MMNDTVIKLKDISKVYKLYERNLMDRFKDTFLPGKTNRHRELIALNNINLSIKKSEIIGVVGRNGAGKSTLAKVISGITQATSGSMSIKGRIVPLLELGTGFNPDFTGSENIYFYCSLQGMRKKAIEKVYPDIVNFAELDEFIDIPVKKYSSGMKARLGFAVSVNIDPDILILDEVLSVGDELFKRKCFVKMEEFFSSGKTIIFITHNARSVLEICSRALLIHKGEMLIEGHPEIVIRQYRRLLGDKISKEEEGALLEEIRLLNQDKDLKIKKYKKQKKNKNLYNRLEHDLPEINKQEAFYLETFKSKSQKSSKKKKVDITSYAIFTEDDKEVNHLVSGELYKIKFTAKFHESVEKVQLGCMIYNEKSYNITGHFDPSSVYPVQQVLGHEELKYESCFFAALKPGIYGIQFVVKGLLAEKIGNVSTLRDGILFKVIEQGDTADIKGLVNLFISQTGKC
jgi:lipopolysaccharide transport system ATP-binding protein